MLLDLVGVGGRHLLVIDDARLWRVQRLYSNTVRLDLLEALRSNHLERRDPVLLTPLEEILETRKLVGLGGHDDFPADVVGNIVLVTELAHETRARDAELRLERTGRVIHPGMDDAAVSTGLMLR